MLGNVLYLANPTGEPLVHQAMREGKLGFINTPLQGNALIEGVTWCADNGCFGKGYPGDAAWLRWLEKLADRSGDCLFATAPDVVGGGLESLKRSLPLLPPIRHIGFKPALVAQDGMVSSDLPWDDFDVLFVGGTTDWKLSEAASELARESKRRGKHTHLGRVNSRKRLRFAKAVGYDSVDGTYLTFGPRVNLERLLRWLEEVNADDLYSNTTLLPGLGAADRPGPSLGDLSVPVPR